MWQAACSVGQHCRETQHLLRILRVREKEVLQLIKRVPPQQEKSEPVVQQPNNMKSTLASPPHPLLPQVSCQAVGNCFHRSLIASPLVGHQRRTPPSRAPPPGLIRCASQLVPLRHGDMDKVAGKGEAKVGESSQRVRPDAPDLKADLGRLPEQQVRHQSNQAVRRSEDPFEDYADVGRLLTQRPSVLEKLKGYLADANVEAKSRLRVGGYYLHKRRGSERGSFSAEGHAAAERREGAEEVAQMMEALQAQVREAAASGRAAEDTASAASSSTSIPDWVREPLPEGAAESLAVPQGAEGAEAASELELSVLDQSQARESEAGAGVSSEPGLQQQQDPGGVRLDAKEVERAGLQEEAQRAEEQRPHRERSPAVGRRRLATLRQRQHQMEARSLNNAVERYEKMIEESRERGVLAGTDEVAHRLILALYSPLCKEIEAERRAILAGERSMDRQNYGPYLLLLEPEKLAVLTIHTVLSAVLAPERRRDESEGGAGKDQRRRLSEKGWVKVVSVAMELGQAVEAESNLARMVHKQKLERQKQAAEKRNAKKAAAAAQQGVEPSKVNKKEQKAAGPNAQAGVEAVMRAYFPDCAGLEETKAEYQLPSVKELRAGGRGKVNMHARKAIESNTQWGSDVYAKVGAALVSIFLRATEIAPSVLETRRKRPSHARLVHAIAAGQVEGVSPDDTPSLVSKLQHSKAGLFAAHLNREVLRVETRLPDTAPMRDSAVEVRDSAGAARDAAEPLEVFSSEFIEDSAKRLGPSSQEETVQATMAAVHEQLEADQERRSSGTQAETSGAQQESGKRRKTKGGQKKHAEAAVKVVEGNTLAGEVAGTESHGVMEHTNHERAVSGADGLANVLEESVLTPLGFQGQQLVRMLEQHRSSMGGAPAPSGDSGGGASAAPDSAAVEDALRAAALEKAVALYGQEWGHLSVPKRGKAVRIPAFRHTKRMLPRSKGGGIHPCGVLEVHPAVLQLLANGTAAEAMLHPRHMPMLVPPKPWTDHNQGGHLLLKNLIMRTRGSPRQVEALKQACVQSGGARRAMQPVLDALNALGSVPWRINARVASVVEQAWERGRQGEVLAGLPGRGKQPLPKQPATPDDRLAWREYKRAVQKARQAQHDQLSQCSDMELKLATMREMRGEERFYYPHTLDFRGRAYPLHPYLNHLGNDVCRGCLMFAEGRPLGDRGLRWLKIHLANLVGNSVDKLSFDEREAYCDQHMDQIMDSADAPLDGGRWWMRAEDPFQALAACMEITAAVRSGDPSSYVCNLAVHQDGSCNGLQHYAALGRDVAGAQHVNMTPIARPADVYTGIADKVRAKVEADAAKGSDMGAALAGHVDRKLVKQTVMTSVYGVTFIGARHQIKARLKDKGITEDEQLLFNLSMYATKITMASLGELFTSARAIMTWLGKCAHIISSQPPTGQETPVRWTTPLGLPVVQPYMKRSKKAVQTILQSVFLEEEKETDEPQSARQKTAFPPNYVHSLDASHMMMTAVACQREGLAFAGVHDSYWTHPGDVDRMNEILREKFIELHSAPLLENLLADFQAAFPEATFPSVPHRGDFDVRSVRDAQYFFD